MAQLQLRRSSVSFRRQGSSGLVWNDRLASEENARTNPRFYSGELSRPNKSQHINNNRNKQRVLTLMMIEMIPLISIQSGPFDQTRLKLLIRPRLGLKVVDVVVGSVRLRARLGLSGPFDLGPGRMSFACVNGY
ncbi:hypothetical protein RDABS01_023327 [Bienertia sinuspersici]